MAGIESDAVVVYVIWIPHWEGDVQAKARRAALRSPDARIREFVTPTLQIPKSFIDILAWGKTDIPHANGPTPWDVHLIYDRRATWNGTATRPTHWASPTVRDKDLGVRIQALL